MAEHEWTLNGQVAEWQMAGIQARMDLLRPGDGLGHVRVQGETWPLAGLLGWQLPDLDGPLAPDQLVDAFVRKSELGVSYAMTRPSQLHPQLACRSLRSEKAVGVHWILSLRTPRLDARPLVRLSNRFTCSSSEIIDGKDGSSSERALVLYRPHGSAWTLVQTAYPRDLLRYSVRSESQGASVSSQIVDWELLDEHLEKGVIRRVQAALWWVPRAEDESEAERLYDTFVASAPPLD